MRQISGSVLPSARCATAVALRALRAVRAWCALCHARAEQRRRLAELDERMLRDIGVTPREAAHESAKFFWQP